MKKMLHPKYKYLPSTGRAKPALQSLRQQAFLLFDLGRRPSDLRHYFAIQDTTAYRYFQQWKNTVPWLNFKYRTARRYFSRFSPAEKRLLARVLAAELNCPLQAMLERTGQPWALQQIINGKWRAWQVKGSKDAATNLRKLVESIRSAGCRQEVKLVIQTAFNARLAP